MNKRLSKYFASFDKSLFVLSATSGNISLALFATVIGAPVGIVSASFLTRSKLNSIESKISEVLRQLRLYDNY